MVFWSCRHTIEVVTYNIKFDWAASNLILHDKQVVKMATTIFIFNNYLSEDCDIYEINIQHKITLFICVQYAIDYKGNEVIKNDEEKKSKWRKN